LKNNTPSITGGNYTRNQDDGELLTVDFYEEILLSLTEVKYVYIDFLIGGGHSWTVPFFRRAAKA